MLDETANTNCMGDNTAYELETCSQTLSTP